MIEDRELVNELINRNENALNIVIDKYGNLIFKIAYEYLKSSELAKECINDVLLKVWGSIERYDFEKSSFIKWIASITKYTAIDSLRKEKKHYSNITLDEKINADFDDIEDVYIKREELTLIINNINHFEEIDKDIFISRFFLMKSIADIAKELNLTENTVRLRIFRARKKLKLSVLSDFETC